MNTPHTQPPLVVKLTGIGKHYVMHKQKPYLLHEILHRVARTRRQREDFWSLRNVNVEIRRGESVAFIGRNGAGKSTILGIIAGAIHPTEGACEVHGRFGALLELGAGFHPDLTGRENIYLNASLLGLTREEIESQFQQIVDYSELEEFIDVPLRNYSSGMQVRLGFAVAIHVKPEILIMDEALAVGDQEFQKKCRASILDFKRAGCTLLFVSHSAPQVQDLCERAIWLDHGRVRADGPVQEVLSTFMAGL